MDRFAARDGEAGRLTSRSRSGSSTLAHVARSRLTFIIALLAIQLTSGLATAIAADDDAAGVTSDSDAPGTWSLIDLPARPARAPERPFSLLLDRSLGRPDDVTGQTWTVTTADGTRASDGGGVERKPASPDWPGIGRDTALFVVAQTVSVAVLYALPGDLNRWSDKEVSLDRWWEHISHAPVWDSDPFGTNYISHPYWGATYYIRARERGFGKLASFGYSAFLSTLYEYGAEAIFEPPSGQDLLVTPILGSLVGAFLFEPIRDWIKEKPELRWYDHVVLIATDPLGLLSSVLERMIGIKSDILLQPSAPRQAGHAQSGALAGRHRERPRSQGLSMSINLAW